MTWRTAEDSGDQPGPGSPARLYSYTITHDTGFAPNPFWGWCTLATCKPQIRRTAQVGDWIAGLSPKATGNRLVYAMQVSERQLPWLDTLTAEP